MVEDGLWLSRKQRRVFHQPRLRRESYGELIQIDGSEHRWFEEYLTNKYGFGTMAVVGTAPMKITAQEEYGLRCILQLASVPAGEPLAGGEIARREGLSYPYVEKLLWTLKRAGLTKSHRGVKGGYVLSRSPEEISLGNVQRASVTLCSTTAIFSPHTDNPRTYTH